MNILNRNKITGTLTHTLNKYPEVIAAYLFGSTASDKARFGSDVDVAVFFEEKLSKEEKFDLRLTLIATLEDVLSIEVDVVDLSAVSLTFQHQVLRTGKLLFERDKQQRIAYEVRLRQEYFDFRPYIEHYQKTVLKRL